ncbi:MAG: PTS sugar transporter subunit IIA [Planctomycetota bacterium]|jgi:mannitol/fructose-specific phosphotransferase system IIA component (Ntr-type)
MKFADFVCFDALIPELKAADRDGVIAELVSALQTARRLKKGRCREIVEAVVKRENEASTGLGKGIALPHVKHQAVKDLVAAIGRTSAGVDFAALDKQPVYSVMLLLSPLDDPDKHLQAMEYIFKNLQHDKFRSFLRQAQTVEQVRDLLQEADENASL